MQNTVEMACDSDGGTDDEIRLAIKMSLQETIGGEEVLTLSDSGEERRAPVSRKRSRSGEASVAEMGDGRKRSKKDSSPLTNTKTLSLNLFGDDSAAEDSELEEDYGPTLSQTMALRDKLDPARIRARALKAQQKKTLETIAAKKKANKVKEVDLTSPGTWHPGLTDTVIEVMASGETIERNVSAPLTRMKPEVEVCNLDSATTSEEDWNGDNTGGERRTRVRPSPKGNYARDADKEVVDISVQSSDDDDKDMDLQRAIELSQRECGVGAERDRVPMVRAAVGIGKTIFGFPTSEFNANSVIGAEPSISLTSPVHSEQRLTDSVESDVTLLCDLDFGIEEKENRGTQPGTNGMRFADTVVAAHSLTKLKRNATTPSMFPSAMAMEGRPLPAMSHSFGSYGGARRGDIEKDDSDVVQAPAASFSLYSQNFAEYSAPQLDERRLHREEKNAVSRQYVGNYTSVQPTMQGQTNSTLSGCSSTGGSSRVPTPVLGLDGSGKGIYLNRMWSDFLTGDILLSYCPNARYLNLLNLLRAEREKLQNAVFCTYALDLPWLVSIVKQASPETIPVHVVHEFMCEECTPPEGWKVQAVRLQQHEKQHSKVAVLFFESFVRVVVTSASFTQDDWHGMLQVVWFQDFDVVAGLSEQEVFESSLGSRFASTLSYFLSSLGIEKGTLDLLRVYDFSGANAALIISVPQGQVRESTGAEKEQEVVTGHRLLREELSRLVFLKSSLRNNDEEMGSRISNPPSTPARKISDYFKGAGKRDKMERAGERDEGRDAFKNNEDFISTSTISSDETQVGIEERQREALKSAVEVKSGEGSIYIQTSSMGICRKAWVSDMTRSLFSYSIVEIGRNETAEGKQEGEGDGAEGERAQRKQKKQRLSARKGGAQLHRNMSIIFPSQRCVDSWPDKVASSKICLSRAFWEKPFFPREIFKDLSPPGPRWMDSYMQPLLHSKCYVCIIDSAAEKEVAETDEKKCRSEEAVEEGNSTQRRTARTKGESRQGWAYFGSHNMSTAAWGAYGQGGKYYVSNYECGVVLAPTALVLPARQEQYTEDMCIDHMYDLVANREGKMHKESIVSALQSLQDRCLGKARQFDRIVDSLPFQVPPRAYKEGDMPFLF